MTKWYAVLFAADIKFGFENFIRAVTGKLWRGNVVVLQGGDQAARVERYIVRHHILSVDIVRKSWVHQIKIGSTFRILWRYAVDMDVVIIVKVAGRAHQRLEFVHHNAVLDPHESYLADTP